MHHYIWLQSLFILLLLNFYCYSSPIPYTDSNNDEPISLSTILNEENTMKSLDEYKNSQLQYFYFLCAIYHDCYKPNQNDYIYTYVKPKRLASNLFQGIPKFGKRAFSSAFSGIPKFG